MYVDPKSDRKVLQSGPAHSTWGNGARPESAMTNILNGRRVLVIDDHATPRTLVVAGLEHYG
jgi:hypothetical protein